MFFDFLSSIGSGIRKAATALFGESRPESLSTKPAEHIEQAYKKGGQRLVDLWESGAGNQVYQGPRIAGLTPGMQSLIGGMRALPGQYQDPFYQSMLRSPSVAQQNLMGLASGQNIGRFNDALQRALERTSDQVNMAMSSAGRYGSGAHAGAMQKALGDVISERYDRDIQNQMMAAQMIDQARQQQLGTAQNWLQAQGAATGQAIGAENINQQYQQALLDAQRQQFQEEQMAPWQHMGRLISGAQALGQGYNTQVKDPGNNPMANLGNVASMGIKAVGATAAAMTGNPMLAAAILSSGSGGGDGEKSTFNQLAQSAKDTGWHKTTAGKLAIASKVFGGW